MNRETKRAIKKQERAADKLTRPTPAQAAARREAKSSGDRKGLYTRLVEFVKEVRGELGRVAWPNRQEVLTYTVVVVVSVSFFMAVIGGMDWAFNKLVLKILPGG